jgi:hypothetical protein
MNGEKAVQKPTAANFIRQKPPTISSGGHVDAVFAPGFA